ASIESFYAGATYSSDWSAWQSPDPDYPPQSGDSVAMSANPLNSITLTDPVNFVNALFMIPIPYTGSPILFQGYDQNGQLVDEVLVDPGLAIQPVQLSSYHPRISMLRVNFTGSNLWAIDDLYVEATVVLSESSFLLKLSSDLNLIWARNLPSLNPTTESIFVSSLAIDSLDRIYYGGMTKTEFSALGTSTPYRSSNFHTGGTGFITWYDTNGNIGSTTTIGGSVNDAIYDLVIDDTDTLFVAGQSMSPAPTLPPTIFPEIILPSNGSGFIARMDSDDWNIYSYQRIGDTELTVDGSAILDIHVQDNHIFYSGYYNYTTNGAGYNTKGVLAINQEGAAYGKIPLLGVLDSTDDNVYSSLIILSDQDPSLEYFSPMSVNPNNWEIHLTYRSLDPSGIAALSFVKIGLTDTDNDGLSDYHEEFIYLSDPLLIDTDGDGLLDPIEVHIYLTSPIMEDTDNDCFPDLWEIENGFDPNVPDSYIDSDLDGLSNYEETLLGTSPFSSDSDGDTLNDYDEVKIYQTNASSADSDDDGLTDPEELFGIGTDPNNPDTDFDMLSDYFERYYFEEYFNATGYWINGTISPLDRDTDDDLLTDYEEIYITLTLPFEPDTDYDGTNDFEEHYYYESSTLLNDTDGDSLNDTYEIFFTKTNPNSTDTDIDGLDDAYELFISLTDPLVNDSDGDGLLDGIEELANLSDPWLPDTDGDGLTDYQEWWFESNSTDPDTDHDLLPDVWEYQYQLKPDFNETYLDYDGDNLSMLMEYYNGTHPTDRDPDNDNLYDDQELNLGTDPWGYDSDGDGLSDGEEVNDHGTNPLDKDSDTDLLSDYDEIKKYATNASLWDTDYDGLNDYEEVILYFTNPMINDTDHDNLTDFVEVMLYFTNPNGKDTDSDGLDDYEEIYVYFTDPLKTDTDLDGLIDGDEITYFANPFVMDTDDDGLLDGEEIEYGADPTMNDTDADGLLDGIEVHDFQSDPTLADTDNDGLPDAWEAKYKLKITLNDASEDPDDDELSNKKEYEYGTDPTNPDTDADGAKDGVEIEYDTDPLDPDDKPSLGEQMMNTASENPFAAFGAIIALMFSLFFTVRSFRGGRDW
ncbi:MAG: hypothetical protein ACXAD7_17270, partial [Candidatus Kariarchaeaceae archaeon]